MIDFFFFFFNEIDICFADQLCFCSWQWNPIWHCELKGILNILKILSHPCIFFHGLWYKSAPYFQTPVDISVTERCRINHLATSIVALSQVKEIKWFYSLIKTRDLFISIIFCWCIYILRVFIRCTCTKKDRIELNIYKGTKVKGEDLDWC